MASLFFRALLLATTIAAGGATIAQPNKETPYVVLVSFDGFRNDYIERLNLPNFKRVIAEGSCSEGLIPSFPSKTFPNHYTIVTGLYPGHHGLVDNSFFDPEQQKHYSLGNRNAVEDPAFYGGVPIWELAKKNGIKTASYFWVGTEISDAGRRPDHFFRYDKSVPFGDRIDQVAQWLALPEKERPHLITLYFSSPDTESHEFGPLADETRKTVERMDSLLGVLRAKIERTQLPVNLILVSDHGMLELSQEESTFIFLPELVNDDPSITVSNGGTQAHIYVNDMAKRDSLLEHLNNQRKGFEVLARERFPAAWHYDHSRAGDLLIVAHPGKYIASGNRERHKARLEAGKKFGAHGYDPAAVPEMQGLFCAVGPNISQGVTLEPIENVHIYPLMSRILGLDPGSIDGEWLKVKAVYRK